MAETPDNLQSNQYINIIDVVCEGPIKGLVDGAKSIYLDNTPIQNADDTMNFENVIAKHRYGTNTQSFIPGFGNVQNEVSVNVEATRETDEIETVTVNQSLATYNATYTSPEITGVLSLDIDYHAVQSDDYDGWGDGSYWNAPALVLKIELETDGGGFVEIFNGTLLEEQALDYITTEQGNTVDAIYNLPGLSASSTYRFRITNNSATAQPNDTTITVESYTKLNQLPVEGSVTRQITDANVDRVRVNVMTPRLVYTNPSSGNIRGSIIKYRIELQSNGGGFQEVVASKIEGKTTSTFAKSHSIELTGSPPWDIRVTKRTADSNSSYLQNSFYWASYTQIIDAKMRYPNTAYFGVRVEASEFDKVPSRAYELNLLKVYIPSNYDPITREYTGIWDGTFSANRLWTDNPAWCFYDMLTSNRYGLGSFIDTTLIDKWSLYEISQYCDELVPDGFGGQEPRFTCNLYLQSRDEALKVLRNMTSIFRAIVYWSTAGVVPVQDAPSSTHAIFSNADVIDGAFNYQGSAGKVRHTVALVSWNDPEDGYKRKIEYVEDQDGINKYGYNETEIVAFGCTSRGQAHRVGKWLLYTENNETETVTFQTGLEGLNIMPGVVIETVDSFRAGERFGGRIVSATTSQVTIDSGVDIDGSLHTLTVVLPDGTIETAELTNTSGAGQTVLNLATAFSAAPQAMSMWILQKPTLNPEKWRVVSITEDGNNLFTINALEYNESKYDFVEQNLALETKPTSVIPTTQAPVTNLNIEEAIYEVIPGTFNTEINVSWQRPDYADKFRLAYRREAEEWKTIETRDTNARLLNETFGTYTFKIWAYNSISTRSLPYKQKQEILGITAAASDVTGFTYEVVNGLVIFSWDAVSDLDFDFYEIRKGTVWDDGLFIATTKLNEFSIATVRTGTNNYMIKARDLFGNYSENVATVQIIVTAPTVDSISYEFNKSKVTFTFYATEGTFPINKYIIRENGTDWATASVVKRVDGNTFTETVAWSTRTLRVKARDTAGNFSDTSTDIVVTLVAPTVNSFVASHSKSTVELVWQATPGSADIRYYELRYGGSDWASATSLGFFDQNSLSLPLAWATRLFRIKAIDHAGMMSAEQTATSNLDLPSDPIVSYVLSTSTIFFNWTATPGTAPINEYEVRVGGTNWSDATFVTRTTGTTLEQDVDPNTWVNTTYRVKAIDAAGNESANAGTATITITPPSAPIITETFDEGQIDLSWAANANTFPIKDYELRYDGSSWETATVIGVYDTTSLITTVEWASRTYRIKARDAAGFESSEGSVAITIGLPSIASITTQIIDNNVLLKWSITNGTLPADGVELRRGHVYASAEVIGKKTGTFTVIFEPLGGTYKYWLTPIDTAGNYGAPISKTVIVNSPPDYILRANWDSDLTGGTLVDMILDSNGALVGPVNDSETYDQHYTNNSNSTPQDFIDDGWTRYIQPTPTPASYVEVFDYGAILASTKISVSLTYEDIATGITITPTISVSTDNISYTDYSGVWEVVATNFRYVKVTFALSQTGDTGLISATNLNVRLDVKLKNDSGNGTANSGDSGGTTVNFNVDFVDVEAITVTPFATIAIIPVVDFTDTPNPTSFKVLLFDTSGNRVTNDFSWTARGY